MNFPNLKRTFSTDEWIEIIQNKDITQAKNIEILQVMYSFEGHKAAASQVGLILGYGGKNPASPVNALIGYWGKRLIQKRPIELSKRDNGTERKWDIFFNGWQENKFFIWEIKTELIEALERLSLTNQENYAEEIPSNKPLKLIEGIKKTITINAYERNTIARQKCIEYWKAICSVCDFNFENKYGEIGKGFIHVHHLVPIADIGTSYQVDPIEDLRPVCPNCHAMLHKRNPPISIEELKEIITKTSLEKR